jgi:hypothetical protein
MCLSLPPVDRGEPVSCDSVPSLELVLDTALLGAQRFTITLIEIATAVEAAGKSAEAVLGAVPVLHEVPHRHKTTAVCTPYEGTGSPDDFTHKPFSQPKIEFPMFPIKIVELNCSRVKNILKDAGHNSRIEAIGET